jgi:hypothetical protein
MNAAHLNSEELQSQRSRIRRNRIVTVRNCRRKVITLVVLIGAVLQYNNVITNTKWLSSKSSTVRQSSLFFCDAFWFGNSNSISTPFVSSSLSKERDTNDITDRGEEEISDVSKDIPPNTDLNNNVTSSSD